MQDNGSTAVLDEILDPVARVFSREVAEALLKVKASSAAQERISKLAEKCNEDLLTADERAEYESYVNAIDLISVLQAKARVWLVEHRAA